MLDLAKIQLIAQSYSPQELCAALVIELLSLLSATFLSR